MYLMKRKHRPALGNLVEEFLGRKQWNPERTTTSFVVVLQLAYVVSSRRK